MSKPVEGIHRPTGIVKYSIRNYMDNSIELKLYNAMALNLILISWPGYDSE